MQSKAINHKVRIYKECHCVCPLAGIGTLPTPLSPVSVPLPPEAEGGHPRLRVRGWGSPDSDDLRKNLELLLLCAINCPVRTLRISFILLQRCKGTMA